MPTPIPNQLAKALLATSFAFFATVANAQTQSLFDRRSPNQIDQYSEIAAKRKGDLLSIIIRESTDVENRDERSLDKTGSADVTADLSYGLGGGLGAAIGSGNFDQASSSNRNFSGDSEFRSERMFQDRFTVTVMDVLPNGNLVVAGKRDVSLQGDSRTLQLTGIVRQIDVLPGNAVSSQLVANLKIELEGQGPEQKFNKQGWLARRLNKHWPF